MSLNLQNPSALTACLGNVGLGIGSTASGISRATAATTSINGLVQTLPTDATEALTIEPGTGLNPTAPNSFVNLAAGEACALLVTVDSASTQVMRVVQGPIVTAGKPCPLPAAPADRAVIGAVAVSNVTNPFLFGSTLLSAAGVTDTYYNFSTHPGGAIASA